MKQIVTPVGIVTAIEGGPVDWLVSDNARLRALIKDKEFIHCGGEYDEGNGYKSSYSECPWCGACGIHVLSDIEAEKSRNCPAFTPGGVVK